jgi:hypothetical protein
LQPGIERVQVATAAGVSGFFARAGFIAGERRANYYGPGLDRVDLVLTLAGLPSDERVHFNETEPTSNGEPRRGED